MARILLIDDSLSILTFMEQTLSRAGHQVLAFSSGVPGIELLKRESVNLMITDIYMPEMDGMEIMRALRRLKLTLPVIAISSKMDTAGMNKMVRAMGAWDTLTKPFNAEQLLAVVSKILSSPINPNPIALALAHQKPSSSRS